MLIVNVLNVVVLSAIYALCQYAECHLGQVFNPECFYVESLCAECCLC